MKIPALLFMLLFLLLQQGCKTSTNEISTLNIDLETSSETARLFGANIVSTPLFERDLAISPQENEIVYTLADYKQNRRCLVYTTKQNGNWTAPEMLVFSGEYQDIEPFFAAGGKRFYFASDRPIFNDSSRSDYNIWYSDKSDEIWSEPVPLDSVINTKADEFYPSLSKNGNLYFTSTRENGMGREDIFMAEFVDGKFLEAIPLPSEINSPLFEFNAFVSPDEDYLIFSSFGREDGFGGGDLYISEKDSLGMWGKARNLGEKINSDALDYCPFVDSKSHNFYFTSDRAKTNYPKYQSIDDIAKTANSIENGFGNIYKISFNTLNKN